MATIARLVTQLAADPAPMEAGFARGVQLIQKFADTGARVLQNIVPKGNAATAAEEGAAVATNFVSSLEREFEAQQGALKEAFARGSLSKVQFEELGKDGANAFNRSLLNGMAALRSGGATGGPLIPTEVFTDLQNQLKQEGINSSDAFDSGLSVIGQRFRSLGRDLTQTGRELTIALTIPIAAFTLAAVSSANAFDHAVDDIKVSTGKLGPALDTMATSLHTLFDQLPNSAADIATALKVINTATDATGGHLDDVARASLNLSRITGTDVRTNVETTQKAFLAFGITIGQQTDALNTFFKTSQLTGVTVSVLAGTLDRFGPTLKSLGLSFGQSAALVGQLSKNGLDADTVLTGLQTAMARFADKGIDASRELDILVSSVKNAGSTATAIDLASRVLGPREGAVFAQAIRAGRLDIQGLTEDVRASSADINKTAGSVDEFGTNLDNLRHRLTDASAAIGGAMEHALVALSPILLDIADSLKDTADAFNELPSAVQAGILVLGGVLAVAGPLVLVLGGLSKTIGAVVLAIDILRKAEAAKALVGLSISAAQTSVELSDTAKAAVTLVQSIRLFGTVSLVLITLGAIAEAIAAIGREARERKRDLDDFAHALKGLSTVELEIKTDKLQSDIARRTAEIDTLEQKIRNLPKPGETGFDVQKTTGQLNDFNTQVDSLIKANSAAADSVKVVTAAQKDAAAQDVATAAAHEKVVGAIDDLIRSSGKNIKVDAITGAVSGAFKDLTNEANKFQAILDNPHTIPSPKTDQIRSALERVQLALTKMSDAGIGVGDVLDEESVHAKTFTNSINALVNKIQDLGPTQVQQLSKIGLNAKVLADLKQLNSELAALPVTAKADRAAFEAAQRSLQGLSQTKLGVNLDQSSAFTVDVTGVITKIVPDVSNAASANFIELTEIGLGRIKDAAERAAVASTHLQTVLDSHADQSVITAAQNAVTETYARLNTEEVDFRAQVEKTKAALGDRNAALAAIAPTVAATGATPAEVKPDFQAADVTDFMKRLQAQIDQLPSLTIKIVPVQSFRDLHDTATAIAKETDAAQLEALAGNAGASRALQQKLVDEFSKRVEQEAKDASGKGIDQQSLAFKQIKDAAEKAGVPIEKILQHMKDLTTLGRAVKIADAFKEAADAAFGANSAVAAFAGGIDQAIKGAQSLADTLATIQAGGSIGDNLGDLLSGAAQSITGVVSAIKGIASIVGSFFGKSAIDKEHDKILKDNNDALTKLTLSLDRNAGTPGELDAITKAVKLAQQNIPNQDFITRLGTDGALNQKQFTDFLHSIGLTWAEVDAQAKALGITLKDSKGNLVGLNAFMDALQKDAILLTTLGTDFSTNQAKIAAENAVAGKASGDAAQTLADQLDAIARTAPDIGNALKAANAQGADALRKALGGLVTSIEQGTVTLDQLQGFKDVNELLAAITSAATDLNALGDTAAGVTEQLVGVPQGFKKALAEFNATAAQTSFNPPPTPPAPPPTDTTPTRAPDTGTLSDLIKQLTAAIKAAPTTPEPTVPPPTATAATVAAAGKSLSDILQSLTSLTNTGGSTDKAVSDVRDAFASLAPASADSATALANVSTALSSDLPNATAVAITGIKGLIAALADATVTVPAPAFHVEQSKPISLSAPTVTFAPVAPITLAPPAITFGQLAPISVGAPSVTVAPFAPILLAPPPVTILPFASVSLDAPALSVGPFKSVVAPAPTVTLASAIPAVSAEPPRVNLSRQLDPVVVQPPPATIAPYTSSVALSPPMVTVSQFPTVSLASPPVSIAKPAPVVMAAPVLHVQTFEPIRLPGPSVTVVPFKPVVLDAPKVTIAPVASVKVPTVPAFQNPVDRLPSTTKDVSTAEDKRLLAQLVDLLTTAAATTQQPAGDTFFTGDINIDAQKQTRKEIFEAAKAEAQAISRATTGSTLNVLQAFQK